MNGNTIGYFFQVTNFGESHGIAIGCVIDGCPPGLFIEKDYIQNELNRRRPGTSKYVTQRKEYDDVEILSGIYNGITIGTPIGLLIRNHDHRSYDYDQLLDYSFRPGHADYTYWNKYGIRDPKGGGRSSARLTAPTVAAGAIAKKWLNDHYGTKVRGYISQIGQIEIPFQSWNSVTNNPFFSPNEFIVPELEKYIKFLYKKGDSVGARVEVVAENFPSGWGMPIYKKLDSEIAHALMGINAVKGVSIGSGFHSISQFGSEHGDEIYKNGFHTNYSGGILGGISTGQPITVSIAIKPTSSILIKKKSINWNKSSVSIKTKGRHDPCVGIRTPPIAEALISIILMDQALLNRGQCG